ncbi:MAG TPA: GAP family protein [Solirubrobacterales bacterium]|nr:GAP family protein [Solirubrobacterales bacterium]
MGDVGSIIGLALFAAVNPTLLAVVTIMMLLPNTKRLMFGYLMGAYITSITLGMVIVFSLHDSGAVSSAKRTLSPIEDFVIGAILLLAGYVLRSRGEELRERRKHRKEHKEQKAGGEPKQSWPERMLGRGSARVTFVVGLLLSFPGVSFLTALTRIAKLDWAPAPTAAFVIVIALVQQLLLELPLLGYAFAPDWTQDAVKRFRAWISRSGLRAASYVALTLGVLLILRGVITLL